MERKLYLLSPLQAEFYENESDRMYPDDVMDGRALAVYGADILQKMQERADHVGEDLMEYYDEKDSVKEKVTNLELSVVLKDGELMGCAEVTIQAPLDRWEMNRLETYLTGQYSDGWGEGFEQQDIPVEDGVLNVHFWNSDYFRMDILHKIPEQIKPECAIKPKLKLLGHDGNVFSILGDASRLLKQNGQPEAAKEMFDRVTSSQSYEQALAIISEYVETELSRNMDQPKPEKQGKRKQKGKGKPMEYAVFKQQIMEQAKRILPQEEGYVITIVDQTEYGLGEMLIINKSDKEVVPGISMEEMYQDFSQNKKSIEEVIETIQDTVNTAFMMIPEIDGTQGIDFRDYDCIKDLLVVELERSEFNGEHLSHGIFEKQPIGALVLYLRLEQKNQLVMARLGRDVLEVCGVSQSTMMKQAMENTIKINPPVVMPVDTNGRFPYFILSNREGRNGATAITYPGMLEQLRKMAGMDFYVIPANIHEVLIVGKTENAPIKYLREALKQRNREMGIQQMLSDHVYEYSGRDKKLKRCLDEKKKNRER